MALVDRVLVLCDYAQEKVQTIKEATEIAGLPANPAVNLKIKKPAVNQPVKKPAKVANSISEQATTISVKILSKFV